MSFVWWGGSYAALAAFEVRMAMASKKKKKKKEEEATGAISLKNGPSAALFLAYSAAVFTLVAYVHQRRNGRTDGEEA